LDKSLREAWKDTKRRARILKQLCGKRFGDRYHTSKEQLEVIKEHRLNVPTRKRR
jgi:hypothetical protein